MEPSKQERCNRVLVVDDDADIRDILGRALSLEGYDVGFAENGRDALDALGSQPRPCVVLLDLMMPVMNGIEFLDNVRADAALAETPVIAAEKGVLPKQPRPSPQANVRPN